MYFDSGKHTRSGSAAIQDMFQELGGTHVRHYLLAPKHDKKEKPEEANQLEEYNFISDLGPKANNQNRFMMLANQYCNGPEAIIVGF